MRSQAKERGERERKRGAEEVEALRAASPPLLALFWFRSLRQPERLYRIQSVSVSCCDCSHEYGAHQQFASAAGVVDHPLEAAATCWAPPTTAPGTPPATPVSTPTWWVHDLFLFLFVSSAQSRPPSGRENVGHESSSSRRAAIFFAGAWFPQIKYSHNLILNRIIFLTKNNIIAMFVNKAHNILWLQNT